MIITLEKLLCPHLQALYALMNPMFFLAISVTFIRNLVFMLFASPDVYR